MRKLLSLIDNIIGNVIFVVYALMISIIFIQVILRYVFDYPIMWAEQISRFFFLWLMYLACSFSVLYKRNIKVDYLTQYLPKNLRLFLETVVDIVLLLFLIFILDKSWEISIKYMDKGVQTIPHLPRGMFYMSITSGTMFMIINLIRRLFKLKNSL